MASETISIHDGWGWFGEAIGQVRIRVTGTGHNGGIFAGISGKF